MAHGEGGTISLETSVASSGTGEYLMVGVGSGDGGTNRAVLVGVGDFIGRWRGFV